MATALITHEDCFGHVTPPGHPEQVERLDAVLGALADMDLVKTSAPFAADDDLKRAHPASHVAEIKRVAPQEGWVSLDADTHMSAGTLAAAMRAAGGAVKAVGARLSDRATSASVKARRRASASSKSGDALARKP